MPPERKSRERKRVDQNVMSETRAARSGGSGGGKPPGGGKEDWIRDQLRRVYDGALSDTIPQDMLDLLNTLDDQDPKRGKPE
jgi:hypothetical protein